MNQMREEFEKWAKSECLDTDSVDGFYSDNDTHIAWGSWQAAQSAAVPVVGDALFYASDSTPTAESQIQYDVCAYQKDYSFFPVYRKPTTSISAAELDALRKDASVGAAIQRAAKELPDGYDLHIQVESGSASVSLYMPDTDGCLEFDVDDSNRLAAEIVAAIDAAIAGETEHG